MIRRLRGEVIDRTSDTIVVDVGGVGYGLQVLERGGHFVGDRVDLHVHTHVREDALQLYGFRDAVELEIFHLLITVPSIGPVKAMAILESPLDALVRAVVQGDAGQLAKLPGIGKRTAERMVVDLREKLAPLAATVLPTSSEGIPMGGRLLRDLVSALTNLGFKPNLAEREATRAIEQAGPDAELDTLIRQTLDQLRRR